MQLPEKNLLSVDELADRWNADKSLILEFIVTGSLTPSLFIDEVECYVGDDSRNIKTISGEIYFQPPHTLLTRDNFTIDNGVFMGSRGGIPSFECEPWDGILFTQPRVFSVRDIRIRRAPFVEAYEAEFNRQSQSQPETIDEAQNKRLERTLVALVTALAKKYPGYSHGEKPNLNQIAEFAAEHLCDEGGRPPRGWSAATFKKALENALKNSPLPED